MISRQYFEKGIAEEILFLLQDVFNLLKKMETRRWCSGIIAAILLVKTRMKFDKNCNFHSRLAAVRTRAKRYPSSYPGSLLGYDFDIRQK